MYISNHLKWYWWGGLCRWADHGTLLRTQVRRHQNIRLFSPILLLTFGLFCLFVLFVLFSFFVFFVFFVFLSFCFFFHVFLSKYHSDKMSERSQSSKVSLSSLCSSQWLTDWRRLGVHLEVKCLQRTCFRIRTFLGCHVCTKFAQILPRGRLLPERKGWRYWDKTPGVMPSTSDWSPAFET